MDVLYRLRCYLFFMIVLFVAEATKLDLSDGFIGENESTYASLGFRVTDAVMIHVTYGEDEDTAPDYVRTRFSPLADTGGSMLN